MSRIALYPGSFDPLTLGHVDVLKRALPLFDEIHVCISNSSQKKYLFSLEEREKLIKECFANEAKIKVLNNNGLTVQAAKQVNANYILRGLRTYLDVEYEKSMEMMNKSLSPNIETIFLFASSNFSNLSSSLVKEVAALKGNVSSFVPPNVLKALLTKLG